MEDVTYSCDYHRLISTTCPDCGQKFVCRANNIILGKERYEVVYCPIPSEKIVPDDIDALPAVHGNVLEEEEAPSTSKRDGCVRKKSPVESSDFGVSLKVEQYNEYICPAGDEGCPVAGTCSVAEASEKKESAETDRKRKNPEETKPVKKKLKRSVSASSGSDDSLSSSEISSGAPADGGFGKCPTPPPPPVGKRYSAKSKTQCMPKKKAW